MTQTTEQQNFTISKSLVDEHIYYIDCDNLESTPTMELNSILRNLRFSQPNADIFVMPPVNYADADESIANLSYPFITEMFSIHNESKARWRVAKEDIFSRIVAGKVRLNAETLKDIIKTTNNTQKILVISGNASINLGKLNLPDSEMGSQLTLVIPNYMDLFSATTKEPSPRGLKYNTNYFIGPKVMSNYSHSSIIIEPVRTIDHTCSKTPSIKVSDKRPIITM